ncbi:MAG: Gfo/Idh/MocA family oxidoreductase, partial [Candidatus Nanopelagicus sp.]
MSLNVRPSRLSTTTGMPALQPAIAWGATPHDAHATQAKAGLRAGIPVVVDKPMGRTLKETKEIMDVS